jgi:hypothetical protein
MRGRAAEIDDAGALGWEVVWEALKTEPPPEDASSATLTQELGLDEEQEVRQPYGDSYATEFGGTRHGRQVALRIGVVPKIRGEAYSEVQLDTSVAPFQVAKKAGGPSPTRARCPRSRRPLPASRPRRRGATSTRRRG